MHGNIDDYLPSPSHLVDVFNSGACSVQILLPYWSSSSPHQMPKVLLVVRPHVAGEQLSCMFDESSMTTSRPRRLEFDVGRPAMPTSFYRRLIDTNSWQTAGKAVLHRQQCSRWRLQTTQCAQKNSVSELVYFLFPQRELSRISINYSILN